MNYRFNLLMIPIVISVLLCIGMGLFGISIHKRRGAKELAVCSFIVALWAAGNVFEHSAQNLSTALFWANIQYIAYAFSPVSWYILVFRFNGREQAAKMRTLLLLSIIPVITNILVWFDPVLGLVRHSFGLMFDGDVSFISKTYGPWFYVHISYCYLMNFMTFGFLVAAVGKKGSMFRSQSFYLLISFTMVICTNLAYVLGLIPFRKYDLTPIVFTFSALVLWLGIFRKRIFRIPPIARTKVFELMASGIIVVDENWNLVDANDSARNMFSLTDPGLVGRSLREVRTPLSPITAADLSAGTGGTHRWELALQAPSGERHFELNASPLMDKRYRNGWAILAEDITDLKKAREQIIRQHEELAVAAERDRLSMELHDTLGQVLSYAVIQSDTILREASRQNYGRVAAYLTRLHDILKDTHEDLRGFVRGIRAAGYGRATIGEILTEEAKRLKSECALNVELNVSSEPANLSLFTKTHIAGILKESCNNIAKHANASNIQIDFTAEAEGCLLVIRDDGTGINGDRISDGSGLGIMRERAACIGGTLLLDSKPGDGTEIRLRFPYESGENR